MDTNLPRSGDEHPSAPSEASPGRDDTQPFWNGPVPPQQPRYGPGGFPRQPAPGTAGPGQHDPRGRRPAWHWTAGIAAAGLLAGGGAIAGVSLAGNSLPAALSSAASPASATPASGGAEPAGAGTAGTTGQAAVLDAALNSADSPSAPSYLDSSGNVASLSTAAGTTGAAGAAGAAAARHARRCLRARAAARIAGRPRLARAIRAACRHPVLRRLALRGVHGEFTFRTKSNSFKNIAFERGTIQSVSSGSNIVVRASDGTTWTWELVSSTVVREKGSKTSASSLAAGDRVWTAGPVVQGAKDARLVVIRPGTPAPSHS
ncbi:MAG: hypothetical protein LBI49_02020 [Nocardiopsaceae bacterium]|nr:hypothetical protein [Nocardiopsaceae bacterium]